jgi:hypothetical protein
MVALSRTSLRWKLTNYHLGAIKKRIAPFRLNAPNNRKENSMESQEKNSAEPLEIDIVELGSASELIQENAPRGPREYAVSPGYYWTPLAIYEDDKE